MVGTVSRTARVSVMGRNLKVPVSKVTALKGYLKEDWPRIREELLAGACRPQPVRKVTIPKPGGGMRMLGIPTVLNRLIQQAAHQVLSPMFDPGSSESSYGFRPGRSAHQAVQAARKHVESGLSWVVDIASSKNWTAGLGGN